MKIYHCLLLLFAISLLGSFPAQAEFDIGNGLNAHWTFDKGDQLIVTDESPNKNSGYLINGPTVSPGIIGKAIEFDGIDDYIDIPLTESLNLTDNFSATVWFKGSGPLLSKGVFCSSPKSWLLSTSTDALILYYGNDESVLSAEVDYFAELDPNQWHQAGLVCTKGQTLFFLNGKQLGTCQLANSLDSNYKDIIIGAGQCLHEIIDNYYVFSGAIDEVRLYQRALSAKEIAVIYHHDSTRKERST